MFCWLAAASKDLKEMLSLYSETGDLQVVLEHPGSSPYSANFSGFWHYTGVFAAERQGIHVSVIIIHGGPEGYVLRAGKLHQLLKKCPNLRQIQLDPKLGQKFIRRLLVYFFLGAFQQVL